MHPIPYSKSTYIAPLNPTESSRLDLRELSIDVAPKKAAIQGKALNEFYALLVNRKNIQTIPDTYANHDTTHT